MASKKFTFKTEKSTGPYRSFYPDHNYIKMNKAQVGMINDKAPHRIRLQVIKEDINEDGNPNCEWKWITLKNQFSSIGEAKEFLNEHFDIINQKYNLYLSKDY